MDVEPAQRGLIMGRLAQAMLVLAQADRVLPPTPKRREILVLSVSAHAMVFGPDALDETVQRVAPQCDIDTQGLLRAARRAHEQLEEGTAHGR